MKDKKVKCSCGAEISAEWLEDYATVKCGKCGNLLKSAPAVSGKGN